MADKQVLSQLQGITDNLRRESSEKESKLKTLMKQIGRLLPGKAALHFIGEIPEGYPEDTCRESREQSRLSAIFQEHRNQEPKNAGEEAGAVQIGATWGIPLYRKGEIFAVLTVDPSEPEDTGSDAPVDIEDIPSVLEILSALMECYLPLPGRTEKGSEGLKEEDGPVWVGESPRLRQVEAMAIRAAASESPVLISGESGTGKEVLAEMIHARSPRRSGPLVKVNMASLAPGVLESELFGHVKGAFTDAHQDRRGVFEQAAGGTLFLDEIGEMPLELQGRLLQVLQEGGFRRVGDSQTSQSRVRILAATHRNLAEQTDLGNFRQDLYYRLNVIPLEIPPLREHPRDIPALSRYFLKKYSTQGQPLPAILPETEECMLKYPWPGNVRELENVLQRAVVMAPGDGLRPQDLFPDTPEEKKNTKNYRRKGLKEAVNLFKKSFIEHNLALNGGNMTKTAQALGIQRTYLSRLIKELDIKKEEISSREGEGEHVSG